MSNGDPGWDGYDVYHPGVVGLLPELPRREAQGAYDRLMTARGERERQLERLVGAYGVVLDRTDAGIQRLDDWFREHVAADPAAPGRLAPKWYSVVNDVALFLGDTMIERAPQLRWDFCTAGRKNISYQRHTITGFTQVPNPRYCIDVDSMVAVHGHRIVAGESVDHDAFVRILKVAQKYA